MPDANGNMTLDEMQAFGLKQTEKLIPGADAYKAKFQADQAAKEQARIAALKEADRHAPDHFRVALATAQAAYENAKGTGIKLGPPSQDLINAAKAEEAAANAPAHPATISSSQPNVDPGSPLGDARDITAESQGRDQAELDAANAVRFGVSGPTAEALQAAQSQFDSAGRGVHAAQADLENAGYDAKIAAQESNEAAQTKLDAEIAQNEETAPLLEKQAKEQADYELAQKQAYTAATQATNQQMARVRQAADEAANAQVKDFWADKSTAGRIIGIISQAFAGAANGLSGQPGAMTPLDRIIERDLQVQQINLNNKTTTSYREQGILGLMNKQFETQQAALGAAHLAALAHVDALAKQISQKYNTPKSIAEYQSFHANTLQKYSETEGKVAQITLTSKLQEQQIASGIIERGLSATAAANAAANKRGDKIENHVIGIKEPLNVQQYHQLAPFADSIAVTVNANTELMKLLQHPDYKSETWRQQVKSLASDTFAARRIDQKTGAKLEGKEAERVEVGVIDIQKVLADAVTPKQLYNAIQVIQNNVNHDVQLYSKRAQAVTGFNPNLNDPQLGAHFRRIARPSVPNG